MCACEKPNLKNEDFNPNWLGEKKKTVEHKIIVNGERPSSKNWHILASLEALDA